MILTQRAVYNTGWRVEVDCFGEYRDATPAEALVLDAVQRTMGTLSA